MKKKIKVLQVIPRLGYGGAETGCYDLAHFLPEQGFNPQLTTFTGIVLAVHCFPPFSAFFTI